MAIRDKLRPDPSNLMLRALRHMSKYALGRGIFTADPTAGLRKVKIKTDGIHTWSLDEVAAYEAFHPVGTKPRLAMALLLYTAQRRSDVATMGRQQETDGGRYLRLRQKKGGEWLFLEDDLLEYIKGIMPDGSSPIFPEKQEETAEIYPMAIGL